MHIIIDGYNMIRQSGTLRRYEKLSLEAGRNALIQRVSCYKKLKGHRMTIVFDGWKNGPEMEERDRQGGIAVVYSRRGEEADDVIKRMVEKKGEEIVVVTSDRGIADFVSHRGGIPISSQAFESLIEGSTVSPPASTSCDDLDSADREDEEDIRGSDKKKGPSRRRSRKKKAEMAAFRKL